MPNELPASEQGAEFFVPDESKRIVDPAKAREMADASSQHRTDERSYKLQQAHRAAGKIPLSEYRMDMGEMAKKAGNTAEQEERHAAIEFEANKLVESVGVPGYETLFDFEKRTAEAVRDVETFERYLNERSSDPTQSKEQELLQEIAAKAVEKATILTRAKNILRQKRWDIDQKKGKNFQTEYEKFKAEQE